jgi:hypothetical protein
MEAEYDSGPKARDKFIEATKEILANGKPHDSKHPTQSKRSSNGRH